jgi:hypothetical protein
MVTPYYWAMTFNSNTTRYPKLPDCLNRRLGAA